MSVHHWMADYVLYPLVYHLARYRRSIVEKNLKLSFPEKTEQQRKQIERRFYHQFADLFVESIYGYSISDSEIRERMVFINSEAFNDAIRNHGGAMAMLAHLGTWEWVADYGRRVLEQNMVLLSVYRRLTNRYFDRLMLDIRARREGECVEKDLLLRRMVQMRNDSRLPIYGMLADQKPSPRNAHFWTTFLNQDTAFLDGSEVLGKRFGYPCFYLYIRSPKRGYYQVTFMPLEQKEGQSVTEQYARLLEANIREQPHLWLWTHNRWKYSRP
jgi:KDO2-lipid IV(A) lauroyltransferase